MTIKDILEELINIKILIDQLTTEIRNLQEYIEKNMEKHSAIIISEIKPQNKILPIKIPTSSNSLFIQQGKFSPKTKERKESYSPEKF